MINYLISQDQDLKLKGKVYHENPQQPRRAMDWNRKGYAEVIVHLGDIRLRNVVLSCGGILIKGTEAHINTLAL